MTADLVLQIVLTVAVGLVGVGLFGALSQQSIVMVMMGLELVLNGVLLAGGAAWYFLAPQRPDAQMLIVVTLVVMAVEMAMGFAVTIAIYRTRQLGEAIMGSHMLVMLVIGIALFATILAGTVLATARGRYDRFGADLRATRADDPVQGGLGR